MRVLVSLLTDDLDDLHMARRKVAYDRLVLVVHPGAEERADRVAAVERGDDVVRTVAVGGLDVRDDLEVLRRVLEDRPGDAVTLNAAGGTPALVTAAILLAFERGVPTLFVQEGRVGRLPVLAGVRVEDRVGPRERALLVAVGGAARALDDVGEDLGWRRTAVDRACRGLEAKGLVRLKLADGRAAVEPTEAGDRVRVHVQGDAA